MLNLKAFSAIGNKMLILLSGLNKTEKNAYGISDAYASVKYSHTLIQQMLLYVALSDSNGIVPIVLEEELSEEMECSIRTIQHNNKVLTDAGILSWERLCSGCIQVTFQGYLPNVLDLTPESDTSETDEGYLLSGDEIGLAEKYKSKKGYTIMSAERVRELVRLKDVNALRIALRFYRAFEKDVVSRKQEHAYLSYNEFKQFLPKYLHFPKAINELALKVKALFDLNIYNTKEKVTELIKLENPNPTLAQKVKGGFLTRLTLPDLKNSRIEKSKQVIELKAVFNQLREYAFDTSDFHTHIKALSDGEIKALVSSFGIKVMKKAIAVLMSLFEGTPISLEESDRPSLIQRFEYNPSLCLREIANNF